MSLRIEGVLLTGGASRRMGTDKATILREGVPLGERIARELATCCERVTVLGQQPIEGYPFLKDAEEYAGPLTALSRLSPQAPLVFVASCDLPNFSANVIRELASQIGDADAALSSSGGRVQPLSGLYRASAFDTLRHLVDGGEKKVMAWIDNIRANEVALSDPSWVLNANTPADLP